MTTHKTYFKQPIIRLKGKAYKKLQYAVLERDGFACRGIIKYGERQGLWAERRCGVNTYAPPHHVIKRSQGGSDTMDNLITLCTDCHTKEHR